MDHVIDWEGRETASDAGAGPAGLEAEKRRFHKGSARMFRSDFIERFSRVHPATPLVLFLPVIAASLWLALVRHGLPLRFAAAWFLGGYVLWTLVEYWLHRLFFHLPVRGPRSARVYFLVHGVHHDYPWDASRLVMPPGVSVTLGVLTYLAFRAALGPAWGLPGFAGFVAGYVFYDTMHWYVHARAPRGRFGRWLRREHMVHHFKESSGRFGVSCPWWDHVFRTTGAPTPVPAKAVTDGHDTKRSSATKRSAQPAEDANVAAQGG
jgi:dihydroceramide fatty acyl 2-hydroxylase